MKKCKFILIFAVLVCSFTACSVKRVSDAWLAANQANRQVREGSEISEASEENLPEIEESAGEADESTTIGDAAESAAIGDAGAGADESPAAKENQAYNEYLDSLQYLDKMEEKFRLANTTRDMRSAASENLTAWDTELNKIYRLLGDKLSEKQMEELRAVQRQWIEERDRQAEQSAAEFEGGTLAPVAYTHTLLDCTKQRTLELIDIYFDRRTDFSFAKIDQDPAEHTNDPSMEQVSFELYHINKKYYNQENYVELILDLPRLSGDAEGIPAINAYFERKEQFFYEQLPLEMLEDLDDSMTIQGSSDGYFVSAHYYLASQFDGIISMSADLDGGAGGVSWAGMEGNVFDLATGEKLGLSDIFRVGEEEYMRVIYEFVSTQIMSEIVSGNADYFFADAYSAEARSRIQKWNRDNFFLSEGVLVVFYDKYELAPGAAGVQLFEIPYDQLNDMLAIEVNTVNR